MMRAPLLFLPGLLTACSPEYNMEIVWDDEPVDIPLAELIEPCLPPDKSVCPIDLATGDYQQECVSRIENFQEKYARGVEEYLLPQGESYDEFINGELPTTVYGHYYLYDINDPEGLYLHLMFRPGNTYSLDSATYETYHNEIPWPVETADVPNIYCNVTSDDYLSYYLTEYMVSAGDGRRQYMSMNTIGGMYYLEFEDASSWHEIQCDSQSCLSVDAISTMRELGGRMTDTAKMLADPLDTGGSLHGDAGYYYP